MKVTVREKQIINLIAQELTTKEIAAQLYISNATVTSHRKNAMEKLKAKNTAGLISKSYRHGILQLLTSLAFITIVSLNSVFGQNEPIIGLEVDTAHDVLFGESLESEGNSFYWSSNQGTLIAGSDGMGMFSAGAYDLDSIGSYSAIFGIGNKMHAYGSLAWGSGNEIGYQAIFSSISGTQNRITPNGIVSNIWGAGNLSDAPYSSIWGLENIVNAPNSTVWGIENIANNTLSSAWGMANKAGGYASTVMGRGNVAKGYAALVTGTYCDTIQGMADQSAFFDSTPLLVVGNGTDMDTRSNALSVFGSGLVKIGSGEASADLHIKQTQSTDDPGTGGIILENSNENAAVPNWQIYNSGTEISFAYGNNRRAYINSLGTYVDDEIFVPLSDLKAKPKDQVNSLIQKIVIGSSSRNKMREEVVLDAAQILKDFPNMIIYDDTGEPFGIDYRQLYLTAIAALQEEIRTNQRQQKVIDQLVATVNP